MFEPNFKAGNLEALAAGYTEDATVMPPDAPPLRGRTAIQYFWQSVRDSGVEAVSLTTVSVDAEAIWQQRLAAPTVRRAVQV